MSYNKLDKINSLVLLDQNNGNVLRTAREIGVNRKTLARWEEQLENDRALHRMFEAAKANVRRQEALIAFKAQAELSRRLEEAPEQIKDADLVRMKDSGLANSKLVEESSDSKCVPMEKLAMDWIAECRALGLDREEIIESAPQIEAFTPDVVELIGRVLS